jgi:DNA-binding NarL/FixJ family response regulator
VRTIGICEAQTITGEGVRTVLATHPNIRGAWTSNNLFLVRQLIRQHPVEAVLLDKGFGVQGVLHLVEAIRDAQPNTGSQPQPSFVVWGTSMTETEALRLLRAGVMGVLRKNCGAETLLRCLEAVLDGRTWVEDFGFSDDPPSDPAPMGHSKLTSREQQVLELVEQGLRNKEIAHELGIRPGTVKIHMKHIFEKTGVHGRYGLAIQGLRMRAQNGFQEYPQVLAERAG